MWPCTNKERKAAFKAVVAMREWEAEGRVKHKVRRQEFARRYSEHLATLPPERVRLLQAADVPVLENMELMRDCERMAKSLEQKLKDRREIHAVRPGLECLRERRSLFLSVVLNDGFDVNSSELHLPEFFCGYRLRPTANRG